MNNMLGHTVESSVPVWCICNLEYLQASGELISMQDVGQFGLPVCFFVRVAAKQQANISITIDTVFLRHSTCQTGNKYYLTYPCRWAYRTVSLLRIYAASELWMTDSQYDLRFPCPLPCSSSSQEEDLSAGSGLWVKEHSLQFNSL